MHDTGTRGRARQCSSTATLREQRGIDLLGGRVRRIVNYRGNVSSCSPHCKTLKLSSFGNIFNPEYIYCSSCSHRTLCMLAATQSESDARILGKAAPTAVFHRPMSDQQFLVASFESSEFLCMTNNALAFPIIRQP